MGDGTSVRGAAADPAGRSCYLPAGSTRDGPLACAVTPDRAGWTYAGLRVLELPPGGTYGFATGDEELVALPLAGHGIRLDCDGERFELAGRAGVFAGASDFAYLPRDGRVGCTAGADGLRLALCSARCERRLPPRYGPAAGVPVEIRGAGSSTREVHNFAAADVFEADRLIAVEVVTPAGNWSSYPPHKHDEERPGVETELEEIYYFEVAPGPDGQPGMAYQRVYGTPRRPIDVLAEVRTGDVVTVPHGWHGPAMAPPGHHLYYLNVMAGPGPDRAWLTTDDPAHAWVRRSWSGQRPDPRLPLAPDPARAGEEGGP